MAYIGRQPTVGNFQICDAISVVNGQAAYTMQVASVNVIPETANHMIVSLNGVIQKPGSSYTVSGSTITFSQNLVTGDVIDFIQILGSVLDIGTPSDGTVTESKIGSNAVTSAKMFSGFKNGITEADQFRLTADISNPSGDIPSNLERVDDATFQKIGTGMSESSGVYTFPSTGKYLVSVQARIYAINDGNATVLIDVSSNSGSNYDELANVNAGNNNSSSTNTTVSGQALVDVTNASTFRVRFQTESMGSSSLLSGNTGSNYTTFSFLRLGDT